EAHRETRGRPGPTVALERLAGPVEEPGDESSGGALDGPGPPARAQSAALSSVTLKKCRWRSAARSHRWATSTLASTTALSRTPPGRGGDEGGPVVVGEPQGPGGRGGGGGGGGGSPHCGGGGGRTGGGPAEELDHPHVGDDPCRQVLAGTSFGVHVATGPEHADEQLDGEKLPVADSMMIGRLPERSTKAFSPARWIWRMVG